MGDRIRTRRKQLGLTQEQLAELADLSQVHIAVVEAGRSGLADDSLIGLSRGLKVSTDYILLGVASDADQSYVMRLMGSLNTVQLLALEEIIRIFVETCSGIDKGR